MGVSLALVNQKGGCGKTTSAIHLAAAFAGAGYRVMVVDLDPQGHATMGLGIELPGEGPTLADLLLHPGDLAPQAVHRAAVQARPGLDLLPASLGLAKVEAQASCAEERERRLGFVLREIHGAWDVFVIDCPPNLGLLTINALMASRQVLIPFESSPFAVQGAERVEATLGMICEMTGHQVQSRWLPTMLAPRDRYGTQLLAGLREERPGLVVGRGIRRSVVFARAAAEGKTVPEYAPRCAVAGDYPAVAELLIEEWNRARWLEHTSFEGLQAGPGEVAFQHPLLPPEQVKLAGDFNRWIPDQDVVLEENEDGSWTKRLEVPPGRYEYKFILRGEWSIDPWNPWEVPNSQGTTNSVIEIPTGKGTSTAVARETRPIPPLLPSRPPDSPAISG